MSKEQQVKKAKTRLPIKTIIAMIWLSVLGVGLVIAAIVQMQIELEKSPMSSYGSSWAVALMIIIPTLIVIEIFIFLPVIALGMKRSWSWKVAVISVSVYAILAIIVILDLSSTIGLIMLTLGIVMIAPLVLIFLDRNNYFEMLRQRELEKNDAK